MVTRSAVFRKDRAARFSLPRVIVPKAYNLTLKVKKKLRPRFSMRTILSRFLS